MSDRWQWMAPADALPVVRQCQLASVARTTVYNSWQPKTLDEGELELLSFINVEYTKRPFYGSRRMTVRLRESGFVVNRKRVQRVMRAMGLAGMAPGASTSKRQPKHPIYPYLLRGLPIDRPNQVWSTDITYIRLEKGFAYLVAVIDWYSRNVLSWRLSNTLEAAFCVDCLTDAIRHYGRPEIFNTDQGVQFTSDAFTSVLKREGIKISRNGRGRALDNIFVERLWRSAKYEDVYLNGYPAMSDLLLGLTYYLLFYNSERPHQSLGYKTPSRVYQSGVGGGAKIVDKYGDSSCAKSKIDSEKNAIQEKKQGSADLLQSQEVASLN